MRLYTVAVIVCAATVTAISAADAQATGIEWKLVNSPADLRESTEYGYRFDDDDSLEDRLGRATIDQVPSRYGTSDDHREGSSNNQRHPANQIIQPYLLEQRSLLEVDAENKSLPSSYTFTESLRLKAARERTQEKPEKEGDDEALEYAAIAHDLSLLHDQNFGQRVRNSLRNTQKVLPDPKYYSFRYPSSSPLPVHEAPKRYNAQYKENYQLGDLLAAQIKQQNNSDYIHTGGNIKLASSKDINYLLDRANVYGDVPRRVINANVDLQGSDSKEEMLNDHSTFGAASGNRITEKDTKHGSNKLYQANKLRKTNESSTITPVEVLTSEILHPSTVSLGKLFGPIVVPELTEYKKPAHNENNDYTVGYTKDSYSTTAETVSKVTPTTIEPDLIMQSVEMKGVNLDIPCRDHLSSSSMILNSLQAGIALMNAGEGSLIGNSTNELPYNQDQPSQPKKNSAGSTSDQLVETQKSIEIYHNAPVQEIHYPPEVVPPVPYSNYGNSEGIRGQQQNSNVNEIGNLQYSGYEDKTNPIPNLSPASTFQQYPSILVHPDTQNLVSSTERGFNDLPHDTYEDTSYGQYNGQEIVGNLPAIGIEKEATRQFPNAYSFKSMQEHQYRPYESTNQNNHVPITDPKLVLPVSQVYPIQKSIEKTVHQQLARPTLVDVEKFIDRRMPYPAEKIIEKQVHVPEPYTVYIQVPIDRIIEKQIRVPHPYPVHVEKVIEKKVPYAIQRFVVQHYPLPMKVPQPYSVAKPIPVPVEKVVEKKVHVPHPIAIEIEKTVERSRPYPVEVAKFIVNSPVHAAYQTINRDGNFFGKTTISPYSLPGLEQQINSVQINSSQSHGSHNYGHKPRFEISQGRLNAGGSKDYGGSTYIGGLPGFKQILASPSKQFAARTVPLTYMPLAPYSTLLDPSLAHRRQPSLYSNKELNKPMKELKRRQIQNSLGGQAKSPDYSVDSTQSALTTPSTKRVRHIGGTNNFRQSKMEYGFKPPMVPSIQYDEKTATKVENR